MNIKTFVGKTKNDALKVARKKLGKNLVVLETKQIMKKGLLMDKPAYELTVGTEISNMEQDSGGTYESYNSNGQRKPFNTVLNEMKRQIDESPLEKNLTKELTGDISSIRKELQEMTRRFRKIISPEFPDPFSTFYEKLVKKGVQEDHAMSLVRRSFLHLDGATDVSENDISTLVKREIDQLFNHAPNLHVENSNNQKIITLIGGTGVGKTTSLMKLAANPEYYGKQNVGIISIDTYRAGALAPLTAFAKIAGITVCEARSIEETEKQILALDDKDVIFVDTPGRGFNFDNHIVEMKEYLSVINPTETLLVLAANVDLDDSLSVGEIANELNPSGLVLTKLDETEKHGKAISLMKELNLSINVLCNGQSIPNNIIQGNSENLFQHLLLGDN